MDCVSVIVTAHNAASTIIKTLRSVEEALGVLHHRQGDLKSEVIVVDDGSTDDTPRLLHGIAFGRRNWRIIRREHASSPSCARNTGARQTQGDILFFLDGDDLFLPLHIAACCQALRAGDLDFVKTGVRLASPVHPDWKERIENSIVINLAIRRACHDQMGGFLDYHLCRRIEERLIPEADVFYKIEDMFYNRLVEHFFRGHRLTEETVEYRRHPGNAYDRQYEKFRRPPGAHAEIQAPEELFRLQLGEVILQGLLPRLEREVTHRPDATGATLAAIRRQIQAGDFARAEEVCRRLLQSGPRRAEVWQLLGATLLGRGQNAEAIENLQRAVQLAPDDAETHHLLGQALARQGRRPEAIAHYRQSLHRKPNRPEVVSRLGLALAELGRPDEAIIYLRQALGERPNDAQTHHNLGVALAQQGQLPQAIESLERALQLQPDYAEACYNLGNVL